MLQKETVSYDSTKRNFNIRCYKKKLYHMILKKITIYDTQTPGRFETQLLTDGLRLTSSSYLSYTSFSHFTFPGAPYRIFLLYQISSCCHRTKTTTGYPMVLVDGLQPAELLLGK